MDKVRVTAGQRVFAYQPFQWVGYETGDYTTGCYYLKCPNGYALEVSNRNCKQGYANKGMMHSGYSECPHGMYTDMTYWPAHCRRDSGFDKVGYRAPCGRTTRTEGDIYGYVTRTRTTTYNKEAGCLSSTLYDKSDASISTRITGDHGHPHPLKMSNSFFIHK